MDTREKRKFLNKVFADIDFISHVVKKFNHADYELYKKRIDRLSLDPAEYDQAIKRITEVMGI